MNTRRLAVVVVLTWLPTGCLAQGPGPAGVGTTTAAEPAEDVELVLQQVRRAVGHERVASHAGCFVIRSRSRDAQGHESLITTTFSPDGRFAQDVEGPIGGRTGFDGDTAWRVMWGTGEELALSGREMALTGTWLRTGYWLDDRAPLTLRLAPGPADGAGEPDDAVHVSMALDDGLLSWDIAVDRSTWLPREATVVRMGRATTVRLDDYADSDGFVLAHRVSVWAGDTLLRESTTESVLAGPAPEGDPFAPQLGPPRDTTFDPALAPLLEVKRSSYGNRLLVNPSINGVDVGWFLFDTGAGGWTITPEAAREAGLEIVGHTRSTDPSGASVAMDTCLARSVRLGPATFTDQVFRTVDLLPTADDYVGLIGHGIFGRCVVEYDGPGGAISLHDPDRYELEAGAWQELVPGQRVPTIEARFEGYTGLFRVDTGSSSWLVFNSPCVERLGLLDGRETRPIEAMGGVGTFTVQQGTIDWFELGGRRFESVQAEFATLRTGVLSDPFTAGLIGNRLLDPFVLVLDAPHDRIAFVPRG
ncbi:MAG: retroviral-like aspartic protease family protein [Planctomycetota bacterium]